MTYFVVSLSQALFLSPICSVRAAVLICCISLSRVTLLFLRACESACRLTNTRTIRIVALYTMLLCRAHLQQYIDSLIRCMRTAILCYISVAPSVTSPHYVPCLLEICVEAFFCCACVRSYMKICRKYAADASRNLQSWVLTNQPVAQTPGVTKKQKVLCAAYRMGVVTRKYNIR